MTTRLKIPQLQVAGLFGLTLLGLGLRLFRIDFRSIWLDEAYSLKLAGSSLKGIIQGAAMDIHPPFYYILLAGWIRVFGTSEWALRSLAALFGTLLIPVAYQIVKQWAGRSSGLWAAGLVCFSPYFIELSRSGRMASQLIFFCGLSILFFWKFLETGNVRQGLGYVLASLAAVYTHYFGIVLLFSQHFYLFLGVGKLQTPRRTRLTWMLLQLLLLLGYAPWLANFWNHFSKGGPAWRGLGADWLEPLHSLYVFMLSTACWTSMHKIIALSLVLTAFLGLAVNVLANRATILAKVPGKVWGLAITVLLTPLGLVLIYSITRLNVFDNRYLSFSALMCLLLIGIILAQLPRLQKWICAALLLAGWSLPLFNQWFIYGYYDNWRETAQLLQQAALPNERIAVYPAWNQTPLAYYLTTQNAIQGIPGRYDPISGETRGYFKIDPDNLDKLESLIPDSSLWLVLVNEGQEQSFLLWWFEAQYDKIIERHLAGIHLYRFVRKGKP